MAPEAFESDRLLNLIDGRWQRVGRPGYHVTPVDGRRSRGRRRWTGDRRGAVEAARQHAEWSRSTSTSAGAGDAAVDMMAAHRDLLALLLVWEIGKPWRLACADVDRGLDGVRWYVEEIDRQLARTGRRRPLPGPVSNIASWNYPMSVQVHAELVQVLAGNAVVAKTPSQGGFHCLTLAHAFMARAGLPVTLLSRVGGKLGDVLISNPGIGALAFVGGRSNGRAAATSLADRGRRHFLEQEGLNAWGVWDFTQWSCSPSTSARGSSTPSSAAPPTRATSSSAGCCRRSSRLTCRCSKDLRFGHPLAVERPDDPLPELDFGPVIRAAQGRASCASSSRRRCSAGGCRCTAARSVTGRFLDGQDTAAYVAPACVLEPPAHWSLHHAEPFGPLDSVVCVDTEAELLAAMNASNGCLVASLATDDPDFACAGRRAAAGLQGRHQQAAQPR